jgi:hypothetical protein
MWFVTALHPAIDNLRGVAVRGIMGEGHAHPPLAARNQCPSARSIKRSFRLPAITWRFSADWRARRKWICEDCGKRTDLEAEPFKAQLAKEFDTAHKIDLQAKAKGGRITRL